MGCEQVCLRWNNFPLNITKNIDELWKDESLVDVSILSDGQCIQAHKVILSAASPLLRNIFAVNPCQHPVIILQDVRFRELISIISFIYKGEVNIEEENLPALLQAARTLQIRGLSDSVDRPSSLNRLYSIKSEDGEQPSRKRRNPNITTNEPQVKEENDLENTNEDIIPKDDIKNEIYPADFVSQVTEEDNLVLKNELSINDHSQEFLQTDTGQSDGTHLVGKMLYQHMPYANLLPSPEVLLRWSQTRSLDQLAIDLMKKLFTTEERLICNVNGKMGKPRFHIGKINLLREVLYHYSGLAPTEFELHWKNCVTKIDTSNRGLKRNKRLRTQLFFMEGYLSKSFS